MSGVLSITQEAPGADPNYRLDVGSVLGRTFKVWASNLVPFCLVGLIVQLPVLLPLLGLALTGTSLPALQQILSVVSNILTLCLVGAVTYGVFQSLRGEGATLGEILRTGFSRLGTVWGTAILSGLAYMVGLCLLIVPGLIMMTRFWVAVPVAVIETPGAGAALGRSSELTEGNRWRVFSMALALGLSVLVATFVLAALIALVEPQTAAGPGGANVQPAWAQALLEMLLIPVQALNAVAPAVAYHDLRVGREGVDIDELLRVFD